MTNQELIAIRDEKKWDNKEWSRATNVNQRVLEQIEQNTINLADETMELIALLTKDGKTTNLLRFDTPQVIAVGIHKGGAGKTTMSINIAYELAYLGYNVLIIDTDSQMDTTKTLLDNDYIDAVKTNNFYECLTRREDLSSAILSTKYDRVDLIPADVKLSNIEAFLSTMSFKETAFQSCMENIRKNNYYDFVIVDMDKNMGQLNTTILVDSNYLLMVSECAIYHIDGLQTMKQQYNLVKTVNHDLKILGVILNKVNARKEIVKESKNLIHEILPNTCFKNHVRNDAVIEKSQWNKVTVSDFSKNSDAARQIRNITGEIIEHIKKQQEE